TFALAPLINRLEAVMPRRAAATVVFFGTLLVIFGAAGIVVWQLATEGDRFAQQLGPITEALQGKRTLTIGPYVLPATIQEQLTQTVTTQAPAIAQHTGEFAIAFISGLVDLVLVLVVTFYLLIDERRFRLATLRMFEPSRRPAVRRVIREVARVFGAYVRAQLLVAVSLGSLVAVALFIIGVPYALFLGV